MDFVIAFLIFILGTLIGSFLNVVILRYNTGKRIFGPKERSICFSCNKKLAWYELVPIVSFCALRGKCLGCKSSISWQYPFVEIITGFIFLFVFLKDISSLGFTFIATVAMFIHLAIWSILVVITAYDLRHKIIPDGLVYGFIVLSFVSLLLFPTGQNIGLTFLAGLSFFLFFGGLWLLSGGRWIGFGDAKLALGVGFLLGFSRGLSALALAFWIGATVSILLIFIEKLFFNKDVLANQLPKGLRNLTIKSEIPFAPFIILGTLIAFFSKIDVFGIASIFLQ